MSEVVRGKFPSEKPKAVDLDNPLYLIEKSAEDIGQMRPDRRDQARAVALLYKEGQFSLDKAMEYLLLLDGGAQHIIAIKQMNEPLYLRDHPKLPL